MRPTSLLLVFTLLMATSSLLTAGENPAKPIPRTVDYEWMSVATWQKMHAANVARAAQGDADVLLIGDSITEGWDKTTLWQDRIPQARIANFGIGGDTTANLLWRLENGELGKLKPRLVVLLIGTNNLGRNRDNPADVVRGIQTIVALLHSRLPSSKILVLGLLPAEQDPKSKLRKQIAKTNKLLARKFPDRHMIVFEDVGAAMLEPDGTISPETMADFLHPTPKGYERFAAALFPEAEKFVRAR